MSNVLDFGVNGILPSKVGGTGTAVKYFPRPIPGWGNIGAGGPGAALPATPSSTNATGAMFLPAQNVYQGQSFNIIASGFYGNDTGDPSALVTINLYGVTGTLSSPTYTVIATTGALVQFVNFEPWGIEASVVGASSGAPNVGGAGILVGNYINLERRTASTTVNTTSLVNVITGLDFNLGNPALQQGAVLGFAVGVLFGTSDASNSATLNEFTIES